MAYTSALRTYSFVTGRRGWSNKSSGPRTGLRPSAIRFPSSGLRRRRGYVEGPRDDANTRPRGITPGTDLPTSTSTPSSPIGTDSSAPRVRSSLNRSRSTRAGILRVARRIDGARTRASTRASGCANRAVTRIRACRVNRTARRYAAGTRNTAATDNAMLLFLRQSRTTRRTLGSMSARK